MDIGKRIKEIAERKKISAIELAGKLGKSRQAVYDIYSGKVSVNIDLLEKMAINLDEPIVNFLVDPTKPLVDRQALKEMMIEILREVLAKHYIHYSELQALIKEIHDNARQGLGLVHLRVKPTDEGPMFNSEYRKLEKKINDKELSSFADKLLDDFFSNLGPLGDRVELKSIINKYFKEKGEEYLIQMLI